MHIPATSSLFADLLLCRTLLQDMSVKRSLLWLILLLALLGGIAFYFLVVRRPLEIPEGSVVSPDVETLEDIGEYTAGRPVPDTSGDRSVGEFDPNEHIRGDPDAQISIVQYSNLDNGYSALLQPALTALIERRAGEVNWVFRHYPLQDQPYDHMAAQASECVAWHLEEEAFWAYIDLAFASGLRSEDDVVQYGVAVGDSEAQLRNCLENESTEYQVRHDKQRSQVLGKSYTAPSFFFVNNQTGETRYMQGADTIEYIESMVDAML